MNRETSAREAARIGGQAACDKKAVDVVVLDISKVSSFADLFVICHGSSDRQVRSVADAIDESLRASGVRPLSIEGAGEAQWVLVDCGDVVFHVFLEERRHFYSLERLWGDAPEITDELLGHERPGRTRA